MVAILTATLLGSVQPRPVSLALSGLVAGDVWSLSGTAAGASWAVPGGSGVASGSQVVLVDNRAPLNVALTYRALVNGAAVAAAPVTVVYPARYVLQSLDGRTVVPFVWQRDGLARGYVVRGATLAVPGRARPPRFYAPGGDGGGSLTLRTDRAGTAGMQTLLRSGGPVVLRTDGAIRDLPAVDLLALDAASTVTWDAVVTGVDGPQMSTDRMWSLTYTLIDDPEPSRVLSAFTWDDIDALAMTWSAMDALALTWDQAEAFDWSTLA